MRASCFVLAIVVVACSKQEAPGVHPDPKATPTVAPTEAPKPAPSPTPDNTCKADKDCVLSCAKGAVAADWYKAWDKKDECEDGCSSKGMSTRCTKGECVAYEMSGGISAGCTLTTSSQWKCTKDEDCTMSCARGAVNATWYAAWDKSGECKDGCAEMNTAHCLHGGCFAVGPSAKLGAECSRR